VNKPSDFQSTSEFNQLTLNKNIQTVLFFRTPSSILKMLLLSPRAAHSPHLGEHLVGCGEARFRMNRMVDSDELLPKEMW
jgi:hypothetical protein